MGIELIGHRGCADQHPENTRDAVRRAAEHLDWAEVDVRRCGSGELVVFHDDTLDRVTEATGAVDETPLSRLRELRVAGSDEGIPTLRDLVEDVPAGLDLQVELKGTGIARDALERLRPLRGRVRLTSFEPAALAEVAAVAPGVPRGLLFDGDPSPALELATRLGCTAINPPADLCAETDVVTRAHDRWLTVVAWRGTTEAAVRRADRAGADAITSDRWDWA